MMVGDIEYEYIQGHQVVPSIHKLLLTVSFDQYDPSYKKTWLYVDVRIDRMLMTSLEENLR
jgi:hypothetical protein